MLSQVEAIILVIAYIAFLLGVVVVLTIISNGPVSIRRKKEPVWQEKIVPPEAGSRVRVIRTSGLNAPKRMRKAWLGLELPLIANHPPTHTEVWVDGYLAMRRAMVGCEFHVDTQAAIQILKNKDPVAAEWWKGRGQISLQPWEGEIVPSP